MTTHQKGLLDSTFGDSNAARRRSELLGGGRPTLTETPAVMLPTEKFDGVTPAPSVSTRDVWKGIIAPVQSVAGKRSAAISEQVIAQFAVGTNPRYEPDAPGKPRGHIFLWDVSRAMGCEVPHFVGPRELTIAQTCDWLRHEGPMRGWRKVGEVDAFGVSNEGFLVIALPREIRLKQLAVVAPQPLSAKPLVTGAGLKRGSLLPALEVLGVRPVEYFAHE
jgi:hypothetical protein